MYFYSHVFLFFILLILTTYSHCYNERDEFELDSIPPDLTTDGAGGSSSSDESVNPVNHDIYDSKHLFNNKAIKTNVTDTIEVDLYCEVDTTFCKKVQQSFISAAKKVAEVVNIKNKIVFQASYYSFCYNRCSNSTYGWGTPSSQFTLILFEQADSNFFYPQALAKQWIRNKDSSDWNDYDVVIDINHDMYINALPNTTDQPWNGTGIQPGGGYWFNSSQEPSIEDHQVDLEYIILHQMMHGMGMVSSWAPYFSDSNSPFQQLLKGVIPIDNLKIMTPSPDWSVNDDSGPTYITRFQPNMIFDKFLKLKLATNKTVDLIEYGFDMQSFCKKGQDSFIINFMNLFLNNATQSSRAKSMYVSLATPNTLTFQYDNNYNETISSSSFYTNEYLNTTYKTILMKTGPNVVSPKDEQDSYYRPGVSTSHLDDQYANTPDFLMTRTFTHGKTLQQMIEEGYSNIPTTIKYNITITTTVNVTQVVHNTTNHSNSTYNVTKTETREQIMENVYKSAIGPGILRILETIGYSTVLTNTNYTSPVNQSDKPNTPCDDNTSNNNYNTRSDDPTPLSSTASTRCSSNIVVTMVMAWLLQWHLW